MQLLTSLVCISLFLCKGIQAAAAGPIDCTSTKTDILSVMTKTAVLPVATWVGADSHANVQGTQAQAAPHASGSTQAEGAADAKTNSESGKKPEDAEGGSKSEGKEHPATVVGAAPSFGRLSAFQVSAVAALVGLGLTM